MKPIAKFLVALALAPLFTVPLGAVDPPAQPPVTFTAGLESTFAADWKGVGGRTYFIQWSLDLQTWYYAPFIHFGDGMHSRGLANTAPRCFYRLLYGDYPGITSLSEAMNADFDGDGLSNIFEVTFGYDPFNTNSTPGVSDSAQDPDNDGMTNTTESSRARNPRIKDNPKVLLQVSGG